MGRSLYNYLVDQGHRLWMASRLRCRWIYWKPWRLPELIKERQRVLRHVSRVKPNIWLTCHTYYKGPDILGPRVCRKTGTPYVIFQGVFSTKRRRSVETWPGYILNKEALVSATHVFTNKQKDLLNLKRIIPPERLTYVAPGIFPGEFGYSNEARKDLRRSWGVGNAPVILTAAMFRSDVKTLGLSILIKACGKLLKASKRFYLVIAGDGRERERLIKLADTHLPGRVRFIGKVPHREMYRFYSAGDLFAFPGINESLGMVYLEAQSCGLPAIAYANEGTPQAIRHLETGILVPAFDFESFVQAIDLLLEDKSLRLRMGRSALARIRKHHDLNKNFLIVENVLKTTSNQRI